MKSYIKVIRLYLIVEAKICIKLLKRIYYTIYYKN